MLNLYHSFVQNICFDNPLWSGIGLWTNNQANNPSTASKNIEAKTHSALHIEEWKKIKEFKDCELNIANAETEILPLLFNNLFSERILSNCHPLPKQGDLQSNLNLAHNLLVYTRATVRFSTNNLDRSRILIEKKFARPIDDFSDIIPHVNKCLNKANNLRQKYVQYIGTSKFIDAKISDLITKKTAIGNCGHMSSIALFKAMEMGIWNTHIDFVSIKQGDHALIVIGRDPKSDPQDYKTWGLNAVVLDTWAGKIFKINEVVAHLQNWGGTDKITGKPTTWPISSKDNLEIVTGNICSPCELLEFKTNLYSNEQKQIFDRIVQQLEEFHKELTIEKKFAIAKNLLERCNQIDVIILPKIKMLKDQLAHFIEFSHQWCQDSMYSKNSQ